MQCATRPRITELNPHLLCVLCEGYLIDATAITECLHAFCKKCIVQYLQTKKYCPVCDVLVHKTKPLQNIKPDKILQSIVYKSVPNLYESEMCNRRKFYLRVHPQQKPENPELRGELTEASDFFTSNDTINLSLEYVDFLGDQNYFYVASSSKRYLRCEASVTVKNLRKLVSSKYSLASKHEIHFFFNGIQLPEHLTLLDIAYISSWKRSGFIRLLYQILEVRKMVMKGESTSPSKPEQPLKVDKLPLISNNVNTTEQAKENESIAPESTPDIKPPPATSAETPCSNDVVTTSITTALTNVTCKPNNENSVLNKIVEKLEKKASNENSNSANKTDKSEAPVEKHEQKNTRIETSEQGRVEKAPPTIAVCSTSATKKKSEDVCPIPAKVTKMMNNVEAITRNDICKEVKLINTPIMSATPVSSVANTIISNPITPVFNYTTSPNKLQTARKPLNYTRIPCADAAKTVSKYEYPAITKKPIKTKAFSRPWNSTPSTVTQVKPTVSEAKPTNVQKPVKFFKARNTPRFLGNPASGIRPLFQVNAVDGKGDSNKNVVAKKTSNNLSVLKIDPKTLCPITSSAPVSTSASSDAKKPFYPSVSKLHSPSLPEYSTTYAGSLPTITSSAMNTKLPSTYPYSNMSNPLLSSMNPLFYGIYPPHFASNETSGNGPTPLNLMKAMAAFHPAFPPSISSLYNPAHQELKHDKAKSKSTPSPPAIQRVPPSTKPTSESAETIKSTTAGLSNGVYKGKGKKEISSFAINNLIPIEEAKNVTHSCSADGVHQVCDQVSIEQKTEKIHNPGDQKDGDKKSVGDEKQDTNSEKNASK